MGRETLIEQIHTALAAAIEVQLGAVEDCIRAQRLHAAVGLDVDVFNRETERLRKAQPELWLASARMDFQIALMKLSRAVVQPTTL